jgi:hypothetical protein
VTNKQIPAWIELAAHFVHNRFLNVLIEIDEDVAQKDDIEAVFDVIVGRHEIQLVKADCLAQLRDNTHQALRLIIVL